MYLLETSLFWIVAGKQAAFIYENGSVLIEEPTAEANYVLWSTTSSQSSSNWEMSWSSWRISALTNTSKSSDAETHAKRSMLTKVATPAYTSTVAYARMEWTVNLPTPSEGSSRSQHLPVISAGRCSISTIALLNRIAGIHMTWGKSLVCGTRLANASLLLWNVDIPTKKRPKWRLNVSLTSCLGVPTPTARTNTLSMMPTNTSATRDDFDLLYPFTI